MNEISNLKKTAQLCMGGAICLSMLTISSSTAVAVGAAQWEAGKTDRGATVNTDNSPDVTVTFKAAGFPTTDEGQAIPLTMMNQPFAGDYIAANVQAIGFSISGSQALASGSRVVIRAENGNEWANYNLALGNNLIGMQESDGWVWVRRTEESPDFSSDLTEVESLSVILARSDLDEHDYSVALFAITSDGVIGGTELQFALMNRFGVSEASAVSDGTDSDGDGLNDLNEILAELDPDFMKDNLVVEIVKVDNAGAELRWVHARDKSYSILKSDTVDGAYNVVESVTAPETGKNEWPYKDVTANGERAFYLIRQN